MSYYHVVYIRRFISLTVYKQLTLDSLAKHRSHKYCKHTIKTIKCNLNFSKYIDILNVIKTQNEISVINEFNLRRMNIYIFCNCKLIIAIYTNCNS